MVNPTVKSTKYLSLIIFRLLLLLITVTWTSLVHSHQFQFINNLTFFHIESIFHICALTVTTILMANIRCLVTDIDPLGIPHLHNGPTCEMVPAPRSAGLPAAYFWANVAGMTHGNAITHVKASIRAHYAVVGREALLAHNASHSAWLRIGVTAAPYLTHAAAKDYVATLSAVRKKAICLGAIRARL